MIIVSGTIELDPAKHDAAAEAMQKVATQTRDEDGNLSYEFFAALGAPGRFRVFEEWKDQAALDSHFGMPYMAEFLGSMPEFGVTGTEIMRYEVSESSKLM